MSRVDELQKKYPSIPRHYIVRWDTKTHGLRDTGQLDEFGQWVRLAGVGTYASYDFDITLRDWVGSRPGRQKPGYVLRPGTFVLPENGLEINCTQVNTKSDLEVRSEGNGKFALYQGDERVEEVLHRPAPAGRESFTSTGKPVSNFLGRRSKHCFGIQMLRHCEYFPRGVACKFCNFNPSQEDARSVGIGRSTTIGLEETVEAYKIFASEVRIVEGFFQLGGLSKSENEVRLHAKFIENMAAATPYKPNFMLTTQPMDRKGMQRLKDVGLNCLFASMEMWDADLFGEVVPGKAEFRGRDRYLEALQEALGVFGVGNVSATFIGGLGMIPENGHKTWQEDLDSMAEGMNWMAKRDIMPTVLGLRLSPGAAYASEENRKKMAPTEYYLELALAQHEACMKYGLYHKLNRLLNCPLDTFTKNLCGELGAYEIAGSLANWAEPVLPREANWYRDWEEQRKSIASTQ